MPWTPRAPVDQNVQFPYRYQLRDVDSGDVIRTYDIEKSVEPGDIEGTEINAAYLQPIENELKAIDEELSAFGLQIVAVDTRLSESETTFAKNLEGAESALQSSINTSNSKVASIYTLLSASYAPLNAPTLVNPTANTTAVTLNNSILATNSAVKKYLDDLMTAYKG